ncbi:hypothetical protein EMCRGX_G004472 [Ephydatia muelleri]
MANSSGVSTSISNHAVVAVANGVSVLVCLLAAILLCCLKLYKKIVYRLALYQILSALAMASVGAAMGVVSINSSIIHGRVCTAIGFLGVYTEWTKLLFTMWVTFHLFCFAVLHKNLKKLEVLYVVTSLLVPALIAIVPLVTKAYGLNSDGDACYIYANRSYALVERLALWDGPAMLMLIAASTAMVVMVTKLTTSDSTDEMNQEYDVLGDVAIPGNMTEEEFIAFVDIDKEVEVAREMTDSELAHAKNQDEQNGTPSDDEIEASEPSLREQLEAAEMFRNVCQFRGFELVLKLLTADHEVFYDEEGITFPPLQPVVVVLTVVVQHLVKEAEELPRVLGCLL